MASRLPDLLGSHTQAGVDPTTSSSASSSSAAAPPPSPPPPPPSVGYMQWRKQRLADPLTQYLYLRTELHRKGATEEAQQAADARLVETSQARSASETTTTTTSGTEDRDAADVDGDDDGVVVEAKARHSAKGKGKAKVKALFSSLRGNDDDGGAPSEANTVAASVDCDTARCHFPGDVVRATCVLPSASLVDAGGSVKGVTVELKGQAMTYQYVSNGSTVQIIYGKQTLFSYSKQLWPVPGAGGGDDGPTGVGRGTSTAAADVPTGTILVEAASTSTSSARMTSDADAGMRVWLLTARLPQTHDLPIEASPDASKPGASGSGAGRHDATLPPTFRESSRHAANGCARVVYSWKVTCHRAGWLRRDVRVWEPILVLPYARSSISTESIRLPHSIPAGFLSTSPGWKVHRFDRPIPKNLVMSRGRVHIELALPDVEAVPPGMALPLLLRIHVCAKTPEELRSTYAVDAGEGSKGLGGANAIALPLLPFEAESRSGGVDGGGSSRGAKSGPRLSIRRHVRQSVLVKRPSWPWPQTDSHSFPCDVQWDVAHLPAESRATALAAAEKKQSHATSSTAAFQPTSDSKAQDAFGAPVSGEGVAHGWTTPRLDEELDAEYPFCTSATLVGRLTAPVLTPPIHLPRLEVGYELRMAWRAPSLGRGRTVTEKLADWTPSCGVTEEQRHSDASNPLGGADEAQGVLSRVAASADAAAAFQRLARARTVGKSAEPQRDDEQKPRDARAREAELPTYDELLFGPGAGAEEEEDDESGDEGDAPARGTEKWKFWKKWRADEKRSADPAGEELREDPEEAAAVEAVAAMAVRVEQPQPQLEVGESGATLPDYDEATEGAARGARDEAARQAP